MTKLLGQAMALAVVSALLTAAPSRAFPPMGQGLQPYLKTMLQTDLIVHKSGQGFEQTMAAVRKAADDRGLCVIRELDITQDLKQAGRDATVRGTMLSVGSIDRAAMLMQADPTGVLRRFVPARFVVFQNEAGDVLVGRFDLIRSARSSGVHDSRILDQLAREEAELLQDIVEQP